MNFKEKLNEICNKYKININESQIEELAIFHKSLIEYNKIHNLTRITDDNDAIIKHYLDSLLPCDIFDKNSKVIDIGCGGGFPSIPLKIHNKSLVFTAIDSANKKTTFVNNIKNTLNLDEFDVIHTRIEDLAHKKDHREQYDYTISRAVAPLNTIIEYSAPFIKKGGLIISYKGTNYEEELKNSENALKKLKCRVLEVRKYQIEELETARYIVIIEKYDKTDNTYPRKNNKPRLQPL